MTFVPTRRRRLSGAALGLDAVADTEALGLTVVGFYDALYNASTTEWRDVRASGGGPLLTVTGTPTLANGAYTLDGSTQYMRSFETGRLSEITDACGMILIGTFATAGAGVKVMAELSNGATTVVLSQRRETTENVTTVSNLSQSVSINGLSGRRVMHSHRTAVSGGNHQVAARVGAGTESVSAAAAGAAVAANRLTIGATRAATPGALADITIATLVIIKGVPTSASQAIWNEYARTRGAAV